MKCQINELRKAECIPKAEHEDGMVVFLQITFQQNQQQLCVLMNQIICHNLLYLHHMLFGDGKQFNHAGQIKYWHHHQHHHVV